MLGAIILAVAFVIFVPVVLASGGLGAAILGTFLTGDAEERYEGSELVEFNR